MSIKLCIKRSERGRSKLCCDCFRRARGLPRDPDLGPGGPRGRGGSKAQMESVVEDWKRWALFLQRGDKKVSKQGRGIRNLSELTRGLHLIHSGPGIGHPTYKHTPLLGTRSLAPQL